MAGLTRALTSVLLAITAAITAAGALTQFWVADAIVDEDRFAGTAADTVQHEEVRTQLTKVIADRLIEQQPSLISGRPLLEKVVDTVLATEAFRPILVTGAKQLHQAVFTNDNGTLILDISDVLTLALAGIRAYDPSLADLVPGGLGAVRVPVEDHSAAPKLAEAGERSERLRWVLSGVDRKSVV